jgi:hypothetical protein
MANHALARLEDALRAKRLDRTLTTVLPEQPAVSSCAGLNLGELDARLGGGLPRAQLSEIVGPRSSGRTLLLLQLIGAATRRGEIAALVDTCDRLDIASVLAAGIDLDRLLWIRGHAVSESGFRLPPSHIASADRRSLGGGGQAEDRLVERALKALNLVLQAGGFGVVAIDLADVSAAALGRIPFTTWLRVQRTIENSETACVLTAAQPLARSAGGLTVSLSGRAGWAGDSDRSRRLAALDVNARVVSPRRRVEGDAHVRCAVRG